MDDRQYMNILARLLRKSLTNTQPAKELIEQMFNDDDFKKRALLLCDTYLNNEYVDSKLNAKAINVKAITALMRICDRENIGIIPLDFSGNEETIYSDGDKINVLFLSGQETQFNECVLEAYGLTGTVPEMPFKYADSFGKKIKDDNPMLSIQNVDKETYDAMKKNMDKLAVSTRFTMFPKGNEEGKIDVSFFSKTEPLDVNKGMKTETEGPYSIPKVASVLLASAILEKGRSDKEYEESKKIKRELTEDLLNMYFESDYPLYLVPAIIGNDDFYSIFPYDSILIDFESPDNPEYEEVNSFLNNKLTGINSTLVPMTITEFIKHKNEVTINPKEISYYKGKDLQPYISSEKAKEQQISESLIDILNRKREQVLLMSDDFNGKNLINLDNYIAGTVHEIIMREDEDYTDILEKEEILDSKESDLISKLESYPLTKAFEPHDPVSQMIEAERQSLQAQRESIKADEPEIGDR